MSDFDEAMVLGRIGELIGEGNLPPLAHGLLRLFAMAIEQEARIEELESEVQELREADLQDARLHTVRELMADALRTDAIEALDERTPAHDRLRARIEYAHHYALTGDAECAEDERDE